MKVLIAADGSEYSDEAIDKFLELFKPEKLAIRIVSVAALPLLISEPYAGAIDMYPETEEAAREHAQAAIAKIESRIRERMGEMKTGELSSDVLIGSPARRILEEAQSWKADLIVAGSHGYGFWERMMLGSVSQSIAQHSPCSVLIVRGEKNSS